MDPPCWQSLSIQQRLLVGNPFDNQHQTTQLSSNGTNDPHVQSLQVQAMPYLGYKHWMPYRPNPDSASYLFPVF